MRFLHITGTITALGIIAAITSAILYFMRLPIFDAISLAWVFVAGLLSAAASISAFAVRAIWDDSGR